MYVHFKSLESTHDGIFHGTNKRTEFFAPTWPFRMLQAWFARTVPKRVWFEDFSEDTDYTIKAQVTQRNSRSRSSVDLKPPPPPAVPVYRAWPAT